MKSFQIPISDSEVETADQDFIRGFYDKQCATATAAVGNKAADLTQEEQFAIAVMSGARIERTSMEGVNMVMSTEPCMIVDSEQYGLQVITRSKHPFDKGANCRFTD